MVGLAAEHRGAGVIIDLSMALGAEVPHSAKINLKLDPEQIISLS